jgi:hypothetical protein
MVLPVIFSPAMAGIDSRTAIAVVNNRDFMGFPLHIEALRIWIAAFFARDNSVAPATPDECYFAGPPPQSVVIRP